MAAGSKSGKSKTESFKGSESGPCCLSCDESDSLPISKDVKRRDCPCGFYVDENSVLKGQMNRSQGRKKCLSQYHVFMALWSVITGSGLEDWIY
jgi:hypothetical protein